MAERLEAEEADFETSKGVKVINTFDGLRLKDDLLKGVYAYGPHPSPAEASARCPAATAKNTVTSGLIMNGVRPLRRTATAAQRAARMGCGS